MTEEGKGMKGTLKRNLIVPGLVLSLLMLGQIVGAAEPQNLLKNAGFEEIVPYIISEPKYRDALNAQGVGDKLFGLSR